MELTSTLLGFMMNCPQAVADEAFPQLVTACDYFNINTPARLYCFLAQCSWESTGLTQLSEGYNGDPMVYFSKYDNRADLGNGPAPDGYNYRGSGAIQLTGLANFTMVRNDMQAAGINVDIVANPDLARTPKWAFWTAGSWWNNDGCNAIADGPDTYQANINIGRVVNGATPANGEDGRIAAFTRISAFADLTLPTSLPATGITATTTGTGDVPVTPEQLKQILDAIAADRANTQRELRAEIGAARSLLIQEIRNAANSELGGINRIIHKTGA